MDSLSPLEKGVLQEFKKKLGEGNEGSDLDLSVESGVLLSPLVMSRGHFQLLMDRERLLAKEIEKDGIPL